MLVEDEDGVRSLASKALKRFGFEVLEAANAGEAFLLFEKYRTHFSDVNVDGGFKKIDLVVTDVILPRLSGHELIMRLKSISPKLKVLYMSGYSGEMLTYSDLLTDNAALLQKPFTPKELVAKVREVLDNSVIRTTQQT